jgi:hypothetical protein
MSATGFHYLIQRLGKAAGMRSEQPAQAAARVRLQGCHRWPRYPRAAALSRPQKYPTYGSLYRAISRAVPRRPEGLNITAATAALRLGGTLMVATLLAACSSSNRVEGVVPSWANSSTRFGAPRSEAHKKGPDAKKGPQAPDTDARGAKQPEAQPPEE